MDKSLIKKCCFLFGGILAIGLAGSMSVNPVFVGVCLVVLGIILVANILIGFAELGIAHSSLEVVKISIIDSGLAIISLLFIHFGTLVFPEVLIALAGLTLILFTLVDTFK